MPDRTPSETINLDRSGDDALPWSRPRDILAAAADERRSAYKGSAFLGTVRPDGTPHAAGIGAQWSDGDFFFTSGAGTQKSRNLAANPACTIVMSLEGIDLVFAGEARRVTEPETLHAVAQLYGRLGWPVAVEGSAFTAPYSAPSAGPPPWDLYRFVFHTVYGLATEEPSGATRWRFGR